MATKYSSSHARYTQLHDILETPRGERTTLEEWSQPDHFMGEKDGILEALGNEIVRRQTHRAWPGYQEYRRLRLVAGMDPDHGFLHFRVWEGMDSDARDSALAQFEEAAKAHEKAIADQKAIGLEFGSF